MLAVTVSFAFLFISYLRPLSVRSPCANIVESRAGETNRAEPRINDGETLKSGRGKLLHAGRGKSFLSHFSPRATLRA